MFRFITATKVFLSLLPLALLASANTNADTYAFSYTYVGTNSNQVHSPGAVLSGQIEGTIDTMNPDRVIVNSFGPVVLARPGLPLFEYASIESTEFNTNPVPGNTVEMSFSGTILNFRSCPEGFTNSGPPDFFSLPFFDCPFGTGLGGGFLMSYGFAFAPMGFTTAADGSGATVCSSGLSGTTGCRVSDIPIFSDNWSLVVLPDTANVDPSVVIGSGSTIDAGVEIDQGVMLGENVSVDKDTSIGTDTTIGSNTVLSKNVEIGSNVMIGTNDSTDKNVVIEDNVGIGNDTSIHQGVYICSGAMIGSMVTIGKNRLVDTNEVVPDGIVWEGSKTEVPANPCTT